jgi:hypothetical protein
LPKNQDGSQVGGNVLPALKHLGPGAFLILLLWHFKGLVYASGVSTKSLPPTRTSDYLSLVASFVLLTTRSPSRLANDLTLAGYRVFAALDVAEVLHLCETEDVDVVVIAADVEDPT